MAQGQVGGKVKYVDLVDSGVSWMSEPKELHSLVPEPTQTTWVWNLGKNVFRADAQVSHRKLQLSAFKKNHLE